MEQNINLDILNNLSEEEQIIAFYLQPNSMNDTVEKFGLANRYQLHKILNKYNIPQHSIEVKKKLQRENAEKTCLEKFGVKCNFASTDPNLNGKNGMLKTYGVEHPYQSKELINKMFVTKKTLYGDKNYNNANKAQETNLEKYGGTGFASIELNNKGKLTCEQLYGDKNYNNRLDARATCNKKYGVDSFSQTAEFNSCTKKKYLYDNYCFDSSWELALYIYAKDHNEEITRLPIRLEYTYNGKIHYYFPDFLYKNELVEIKGDHMLDANNNLINIWNSELNEQAIAKQACMKNNNVSIYNRTKITPYLNYIKDTYGKNYLSKFLIKSNSLTEDLING